MKGQVLYLSICAIVLDLLSNSHVVYLVFLLFILYHIRHFYKGHLLCILFCSLFLLRFTLPQTNQIPTNHTVSIMEIKKNYVIASTGDQKVVVYGLEDVNYRDILYLRGDYEKVDTIHNANTFSFQEYLKKRGILYAIQVKGVERIAQGNGLRHQVMEHVLGFQKEDVKAFLLCVLYGIQDEDDVSYMLLSSGMHISFLAYLLERLGTRIIGKTNASILCFFFILLVAYCTVFSGSLQRILCFKAIAIVCNKADGKDRLGYSILLLLCLSPYMVSELSFVLPVCFRFASLFHFTKRRRFFLSYGILLPIQLCYFHICNPIQIFLFRFLRIAYAYLYATALLFMLGFPSILLSWNTTLLKFLQNMEQVGFELYGKPPLLWLCLWCLWFLRLLQHKAKYQMIKGCCLFCFLFLYPYVDPFAHVTMLDVGQGDCTLIELPFRKGVYLIDVMGHKTKNIPKDIIVPVLRARGIYTIDRVLITHQDFDHSGGLEQLKKEIPVKEVIDTKEKAKTKESDILKFFLLDYKGNDENENSIVTLLKLYDTTMIFMGDLGIEGEKELMQRYPKLEADILKVGHHGSKTSSLSSFLHQVHPRLALISSGRKNRYGHPHKEVLHSLTDKEITTLVSAYQGSVTLSFLPNVAVFETANDGWGYFFMKQK